MGYLTFDIFGEHSELTCAVAKSDYGNMSILYSPKDETIANRVHFYTDLGVDHRQVVVASLDHSTDTIIPTLNDRGKTIDGDIMMTDMVGTFLFFVIADCAGIALYDPVHHAVALAHSGWKGTNLHVPEVTIAKMTGVFRTNPEDLLVAISPAIHKESMNFEHLKQITDAGWSDHTTKMPDGKYQIDNIGFVKSQLIKSGVKPSNIEISLINTRTTTEYFSHRRSVEENKPEQRFGMIIGLNR